VQRDAALVREFLGRVRRRLTLLAAARGAAIGLGAAILLALGGWPSRQSSIVIAMLGIAAAMVGSLISVLSTAAHRRRAATVVERRVPESRNLLVTTAELLDQPSDDYVLSVVFGRAARLIGRIDLGTLFPARNVVLAMAVAATAWLLVVGRSSIPIPASLRAIGSGAAATPSLDAIDVTVTPPAYLGRAPQTYRDPRRVDAMVGSEIAVSVRARADRVVMEALSSSDTLSGRGERFAGKLIADADGFIALQPSAKGRVGERRLIGLTMLRDSLPRVRIATPGRDQRLASGHAALDVAIDATDDFGLASLTLRFTKVSGSGERFAFSEGQVPLSIVRRDARSWTARARWVLDSLELEPGDMVVYRAVAADRRAVGGSAESDSYIAEVLAPGGVAAAGFAIDPEQERYAVSQQMVILKTERLIARRTTLSTQDLADESQQLAAEQRKVRAEFVFMLGGELADDPELAASMTEINEEEEAARESEILEGRTANAGHVALLRAIRAMSRASAALTAGDPTTALPHERAALQQLERAFSHSRILLRALTTRERLDPSRRLTGVLGDAVGEAGRMAEASAAPLVVTLRRSLTDLTTLAALRTYDAGVAARISALAERLLRIDPSSRALQSTSTELGAAAKASSDGRADAVRAALDRSSIAIVAMLRRELPESPRRSSDLEESRMQGALVEALRSRPR
jgi:hypothetical protein